MRIRSLLLAALVAGLATLGAPAGATTLALPNGTHTIFDVFSGQIEFHWDHDSPYQLVGSGPTVLEDDVYDGEFFVGTIYEITIPNFYDPLPRKELLIEMAGGNGGATPEVFPRVLDIIGADSPYGAVGPAVPVFGIFDDAFNDEAFRAEKWVMYPNPDFETVKIWAPIEFELTTITIWTQSIPEPASAALLGSGLLALALVRRRR